MPVAPRVTRCTYRWKPGQAIRMDADGETVLLELVRSARGEAVIRLRGAETVSYRMMTPAESKAAIEDIDGRPAPVCNN